MLDLYKVDVSSSLLLWIFYNRADVYNLMNYLHIFGRSRVTMNDKVNKFQP